MKISIFGYGVTTTPLVEFLNKQGLRLRIYDDKFTDKQTDSFGNELLPSSEFTHFKEQSELEILSPGIPPYHQLVQEAKNLISEYDYFANLLDTESSTKKPLMIWISGTNGKTTTTEMTTLLLKKFGAQSGGNIGTPLATLYEQKPPIWVLETSSFSLHYTKKAIPTIYALLPVREDHITWHGGFEGYVNDKLSPLLRMQKDSFAFIPSELESHSITKAYSGNIITYKDSNALANYLGIKTESINFKEPFLLDALLALCVAQSTSKATIKEYIDTLKLFHIGAHRIEEFYDDKGRLWVDDSKGTNVDATIEAVRRYEDRHLIIILGGDDKGANLTPLFAFMRGKDIEIYTIGSNESRLLKYASEYQITCVACENLANAMSLIKAKRADNDVVLLSPAAASLDQFSSYKERGDMFQKIALQP